MSALRQSDSSIFDVESLKPLFASPFTIQRILINYNGCDQLPCISFELHHISIVKRQVLHVPAVSHSYWVGSIW
jgi:hypothetical protein